MNSRGDQIARFAIDKGRLGKDKHMNDVVRPKAFAPNSDLQVSVFFITELSHSAVKNIGVQVGNERAKKEGRTLKLYGWAEFQSSLVTRFGLRIQRDDSCTYGDHANILGWPQDAQERMSLQVDLAAGSSAARIKTITCNP